MIRRITPGGLRGSGVLGQSDTGFVPHPDRRPRWPAKRDGPPGGETVWGTRFALLVAQGVDGVQDGGLKGGDDAEEDAHAG